jgi:hypothetical protein
MDFLTLILIIIATYVLILWDFTLSYSNGKKEYKIEYNGLLWVGLDYWSICKYKSSDKPIKWINITRS